MIEAVDAQMHFQFNMTMNNANKNTPNMLSEVLVLTRHEKFEKAAEILALFIAGKFSISPIKNLSIRRDGISLNSVNGIFENGDNKKYFFKFHLEENETATIDEYYKAELLAKTGYPVELPVFVSRDVGEQILIYPYVEYERLFDVCRRLDHETTELTAPIVAAQEKMDKLSAEKCIQTLSMGNREDYSAEPILQLFYWRLVDKKVDGVNLPGGRWKNFYLAKDFVFPNLQIPYSELIKLKWNINGALYPVAFGDAFEKARDLLAPGNITEYAACTAHGDAHNGNVWVKGSKQNSVEFSYFDPAFAGEKIPVLLSEIKSTFHNILAHPDWLYNPADADKNLSVSAEITEGVLYVRHNWALSPLREKFLLSKKNNFWMPVLRELQKREWLPPRWEDFIRMALFCCPTLVMNLRAGEGNPQNVHTPKTSLLGLSIAIMCASAPISGSDPISGFFHDINEALRNEKRQDAAQVLQSAAAATHSLPAVRQSTPEVRGL